MDPTRARELLARVFLSLLVTALVGAVAHVTGPRRGVRASVATPAGTLVHVGPGFGVSDAQTALVVGVVGGPDLPADLRVEVLVARPGEPNPTTVPMARDRRAFRAELAAAPAGSVVSYAFRASTGGVAVTLPRGGAFSFRVLAPRASAGIGAHVALALAGVFFATLAAGAAERELRGPSGHTHDLRRGRPAVLLAAAAGLSLGAAGALLPSLLALDGLPPAGPATLLHAFGPAALWGLAALSGAARLGGARFAPGAALAAFLATLASALFPHAF